MVCFEQIFPEDEIYFYPFLVRAELINFLLCATHVWQLCVPSSQPIHDGRTQWPLDPWACSVKSHFDLNVFHLMIAGTKNTLARSFSSSTSLCLSLLLFAYLLTFRLWLLWNWWSQCRCFDIFRQSSRGDSEFPHGATSIPLFELGGAVLMLLPPHHSELLPIYSRR